MIIKIATCLLAASLFAACQSTQSTASSGRPSLQERAAAQSSRYASANPNAVADPVPPAEGPEDIPGEGPVDPNRNPGLLPTPLLRSNAAAGL